MKSMKMFKKGLLSVAVVTAVSAYAVAAEEAVAKTESKDVTVAPKAQEPKKECKGACCSDCTAHECQGACCAGCKTEDVTAAAAAADVETATTEPKTESSK